MQIETVLYLFSDLHAFYSKSPTYEWILFWEHVCNSNLPVCLLCTHTHTHTHTQTAQLLQLYPTLCDTVDYSPLGSSVHGIVQARIPEWVAVPSSRGSFPLRDGICVSWSAGGFFTAEPLGNPIYVWVYIHTHTYLYMF